MVLTETATLVTSIALWHRYLTNTMTAVRMNLMKTLVTVVTPIALWHRYLTNTMTAVRMDLTKTATLVTSIDI
jgi:hypothetical protein